MFSNFASIFSTLLLFTSFVYCDEPENSTQNDEDGLGYRLPETVIPTSYELKIIPNLKDNFDFEGDVTINVKAITNTNEVFLHCHELSLRAISISNETEKINQDGYEFIPDRQFLKLKLKNELQKNNEYIIRIWFKSPLRDEPVGFYREKYKHGKEIKWLATTQLEPIYARTVFPCFDEPHFKTPFSIHIARSENHMTLANMPYIMSKGPEPKIQNRTWDMFESKQSISTFQVAFTVTEYFFKPDVDTGVLLGTPNRGSKNIFEILTKSKIILKELESYTQMNFTKENMHMVAISDFLVGALDNSGLSTIKEPMTILSRSKTSTLSKEVTELAAVHEFAHQWFGDYVTPIWWKYMWLKEAFATFMEYKILNTIEPKWKMKELFITDIVQQALLQDKYSHPMSANIQTPAEIINAFDFVMYQKGASVLKMLEFMITPSTFKKGVQRYLKRGVNKTLVTPDDLWEVMEEQVQEDKIKLPTNVREIMKPWTEQASYPLITVTIENFDVLIKQEPYNDYPGYNESWIVPITYAIPTDDLTVKTPMEWLNPDEQLVLDKAVEAGQWIIVNLGQFGYYRVNYDYNNWQALTDQLLSDHNAIDPVLRAKLIDDALNLAMDKKLNYNTALSLLDYFPKEKHYLPQISVLYNLKNLFIRFEQTSIETWLKIFISKLIDKLYHSLGTRNGLFDTHITKRIRKDVVYLACKIDIKKCLTSTSALFHKNYKRLEKIDENLKPAVFCTAFEQLREDFVFHHLLMFYNDTNSALDREIIVNSFACIRNSTLIQAILARNITILRKRDIQKANDIVLRSGKNPLAITEYIRSVLSGISGNIIPKNIENDLKYIIRSIKIVNVEQLRALNNLLHEVRELERFHTIMNELANRSNNATVFIRETERAALEVNETIHEKFFASQNESGKFGFLLHPIKYFRDSHKIRNGLIKINNIRHSVQKYIVGKFKNATECISGIFRFSNPESEFYPLNEHDPSTQIRSNNDFMLSNSSLSNQKNLASLV
ncbi:aminopeptidase Ey-like [Planococcus citri]|uniref:aminopeptidase Ey-like n=1 Tax=Planococcus citri TaxID=170843 RepID=UPI0031F84E00